MGDVKDGGPAFPTLRDWFAGQAMQGMLSNPSWDGNNISKPDNGSSIPELAFEVADALLAARSTTTDEEKNDG